MKICDKIVIILAYVAYCICYNLNKTILMIYLIQCKIADRYFLKIIQFNLMVFRPLVFCCILYRDNCNIQICGTNVERGDIENSFTSEFSLPRL